MIASAAATPDNPLMSTNRTNHVHKGSHLPLFHQREQTCHDRSRHCSEWAELAECRKKNARAYMKDNCPLSCNLCNPLLEPWLPREDNPWDSHRATFESQSLLDFSIFTGVSQKLDDIPILPDDGNLNYSMRRFHDVMLSQSKYLDEYYQDIHYFKSGTWIQASSIDVDAVDVPDGTELPLAETCINRHPYCAQWAIKGFCDSQPLRMKVMCAPMCHLCDTIELNGSRVSVLEEPSYHSSPFHRNDLFGIMDAIEEDRVIIDWPIQLSQQVASNKRMQDGTESTYLDISNIQKSVIVEKRSEESMVMLQNVMQSHETGISRQQMILMDNFTTAETCMAILDTIKFGVGINNHVKAENLASDGFPMSTTTSTNQLMEEQGILDQNEMNNHQEDNVSDMDAKIVRKSSTVLLYPTIQHGNETQYAPSIERLIEKVALLVGIPVANIETPLVVEKFTPGEFRRETCHFDKNVSRELLKSAPSNNVTSNQEYKDYPLSIMNNARVFGFVLFLNHVQEGGHMHFPNFSNYRISPKVGRAVLFPTVVSLNGIWDPQVMTPVDGQLHDSARMRKDSFLVEDRSTRVEHEKVVQGTKYTLTIYFRRYEPIHA